MRMYTGKTFSLFFRRGPLVAGPGTAMIKCAHLHAYITIAAQTCPPASSTMSSLLPTHVLYAQNLNEKVGAARLLLCARAARHAAASKQANSLTHFCFHQPLPPSPPPPRRRSARAR